METDVEGVIGAARHERSGIARHIKTAIAIARSTPLGALQLRIPKLRQAALSRPSAEQTSEPAAAA